MWFASPVRFAWITFVEMTIVCEWCNRQSSNRASLSSRRKEYANVKPPPAQTCHPDEGRIPSETQSLLMNDGVLLLAYNFLWKAAFISLRIRLFILLRLLTLLGHPFSKWQPCGGETNVSIQTRLWTNLICRSILLTFLSANLPISSQFLYSLVSLTFTIPSKNENTSNFFNFNNRILYLSKSCWWVSKARKYNKVESRFYFWVQMVWAYDIRLVKRELENK